MLSDEEEEDDEVGEVLTLPLQAHRAMEKMEEFVHKVNVFFFVFVFWGGALSGLINIPQFVLDWIKQKAVI